MSMSEPKRVALPLSEADARELRAGDRVLLDGVVTITAGLPTHHRMLECLQSGTPLPIDLDGVLLHLGGYSVEDASGAFRLLYINPTTSTRFNDLMPALIEGYGLRVIGGKGGLDERSVAAMQRVGCIYLSFLGGGCTPLSSAIVNVEEVGWADMLTHYRLARVRVEGLGPCTVAIDAHGRSLYEEGRRAASDRLPDILARLDAERDSAGR